MSYPNILGAPVLSINTHNGIHIKIPGKNGCPAKSDVVKHVSAADETLQRQGKICSKSMTVVPMGVLCEFEGGLAKLVPFANIYEADLDLREAQEVAKVEKLEKSGK